MSVTEQQPISFLLKDSFSPLKDWDPRSDWEEKGCVLTKLEGFYGAVCDGDHTYYWKKKAEFFEVRLEVQKHFVGEGIFAYQFSNGAVVVRERLECKPIKVGSCVEWVATWEVISNE